MTIIFAVPSPSNNSGILFAVPSPSNNSGILFAAPFGWSGPTSGLTHRWPMDDAHVSGTTITDVIGSLNGTASGAGVSSTTGPGSGNTARAFDGASYISLASSPVDFTANHSVFFWAFIVNNTLASGANSQRYFSFYTESGNQCVCANDETRSGTFVAGLNGSSSNQTETNALAVPNGTWTHVGWTCTSGVVTIYVNGSAVASTTASWGFGYEPSGSTIGARDTIEGFLTGRMFEFVTYNRALSSGEVSTLYGAY